MDKEVQKSIQDISHYLTVANRWWPAISRDDIMAFFEDFNENLHPSKTSGAHQSIRFALEKLSGGQFELIEMLASSDLPMSLDLHLQDALTGERITLGFPLRRDYYDSGESYEISSSKIVIAYDLFKEDISLGEPGEALRDEFDESDFREVLRDYLHEIRGVDGVGGAFNENNQGVLAFNMNPIAGKPLTDAQRHHLSTLEAALKTGEFETLADMVEDMGPENHTLRYIARRIARYNATGIKDDGLPALLRNIRNELGGNACLFEATNPSIADMFLEDSLLFSSAEVAKQFLDGASKEAVVKYQLIAERSGIELPESVEAAVNHALLSEPAGSRRQCKRSL